MKKIVFTLPLLLFLVSCEKEDPPVFGKATVETRTVEVLAQGNTGNDSQQKNANPPQKSDSSIAVEDNNDEQ